MLGIRSGVRRFAARAWRWRVHRGPAAGPSFPHRRGFCFCVFDEEPLLPPRRFNLPQPLPHTRTHARGIPGTCLDAAALTGSPGTESQGGVQRWHTNQLQPPAAKLAPGPRECFIRCPDPPPPPPLPNLAAAMSSDGVVQVVEESGDCSDAPDSFAKDADLGAEVLSILVVLGTQASEKSTLYNAALGTAFPVAARRAPGALPPAASPQQRPADTPPYSHSTSRAAPPAPAAAWDASSRHTDDDRRGGGDDDGEPDFRSALVFVVCDADDDVEHDLLHRLVVKDAREFWKSIAPSGSGGGTAPALEAFFVVSTVALPHLPHRADQFEDACNTYGRRLTDSKASDHGCKF
jgi:hypothetical protein